MDWHLHGGPIYFFILLTKAKHHYSMNKSEKHPLMSLDEKDGIFSIKMKLKSRNQAKNTHTYIPL